jgi:hypothetical protein
LNGDGVIDSQGAYRTYDASSLVIDPSPRLVVLPDAVSSPGAFGVLATNVPSLSSAGSSPLDNMIRPGESIYIAFNHAVVDSSVLVKLTDEEGKENLAVSKSVSATGNVLLLHPVNPLTAGREYNLSVRALSAVTGTTYTGTAFLFGGDPASPVALGLSRIGYEETSGPTNSLSYGETVYVFMSQPISQPQPSGLLYAFIKADIDASGVIGDTQGEFGHSTGFQLFEAEPNGVPDGLFTLKPSGYSSRYRFIYYGFQEIALQTAMVIGFSRLKPPGEFQGIWGQALISDENGTLARQ